jgi:type IV pilus assembly protein PilV
MQLSTTPRQQRGIGLIDALIALAILSFGLLALTRFQARLLAQGSDAQARLAATQRADELLGMAVLDASFNGASNGPCYAVPVAAGCTKAAAQAAAASWAASAVEGMPGAATAGAVWNAATNQLTATISWTGKVVQEGVAAEQHQMSVTTDVR